MVEPKDRCLNCRRPIYFGPFKGYEPDLDAASMRDIWRHMNGYAACGLFTGNKFATPGWPEVVTLCGSTKFRDAFFAEQKRLTIEDRCVVISVGTFGHLEGLDIANADGSPTDLKIALDELHKRKIDLSDRIHVINVGGYIGSSTRGEIAYAFEHGKKITWLEEPNPDTLNAIVEEIRRAS